MVRVLTNVILQLCGEPCIQIHLSTPGNNEYSLEQEIIRLQEGIGNNFTRPRKIISAMEMLETLSVGTCK